MSEEHKAALAKGRAEGKAVRDYLDGLRQTKPRRGRKRTPESIRARLDAIELALADADPLEELKLVQERRDLTEELENAAPAVDMADLEAEFVRVAKSYSDRQGISYASWREVGVEAAVLKRAGISRGD
jgi:uncharacterized protein YicC (UPF0701 family)